MDQLLKPNGEGEPLFDYEEINRLWKLWDNNGSVKEEQQQIKTETLYEEEQQDEQPLSQSIKDENCNNTRLPIIVFIMGSLM